MVRFIKNMDFEASKKPNAKQRKGLWSPDEDQKLRDYVINYGHGCWTTVPINAGLERNGKSCRLRWINYLRPGLKRGTFSIQEEETILTLHALLGNKWSQISQHLAGRTDNEIKNYWHSSLKKKAGKLKNPNPNPTNSNMETTESSSSYQSSITRNSSFNSSNSSSTNEDQLVAPVDKISNLPKILFADWLGLDEFYGLSHESIHQEKQVQSSISNEGSTRSIRTEGSLVNYSNEDLFHNEMTIDQIFNFNNGQFNIDDFMYM